MTTTPVRISKGRFEAFSDGVFAIAITLLVLEFRPPELANPSNATMAHALLALWPIYLVYAASFIAIGIMWFNHYALFHQMRHVSYSALVANLALLMSVAFIPYPTLLLGRYGLMPTAVAYYGLTFFVNALCWNVLWYVATLRHEQRGNIVDFFKTRRAWNTIGPVFYAIGSALAFVSPLGAIVLFALMALYYVLPGTMRFVLSSTAAAHEGEAEPPN